MTHPWHTRDTTFRRGRLARHTRKALRTGIETRRDERPFERSDVAATAMARHRRERHRGSDRDPREGDALREGEALREGAEGGTRGHGRLLSLAWRVAPLLLSCVASLRVRSFGYVLVL